MPGIFRPPFRRPARTTWIPTAAPAGGSVVVNVDTPGVITWTGSSVTLAYKEVVTAGAITWTGSSVVLAQKQVVTAGVITWTGSAVVLKTAVVVTGGVITWTGSSVVLKLGVGVTAGVITWSGATDITVQVGGAVVVNVDVAGAITWTGQSVTLAYKVTPTPGAITWTGQGVSLTVGIVVAAGVVTWTGSNVTVINSGAIGGEPVKGPTRKLVLSGATTAPPGLVGIAFDEAEGPFDSPIYDFDGNFVGRFGPTEAEAIDGDEGLNDSEELVGAPRVVLIGAGRNSLVEV